MANEAIPRAYDRPEPVAFVPHSPLRSNRWSGQLSLEWTIDPAHAVVIGAGWQDMAETGQGERDIVAEIVRRGDERVPVLPGSSLKGAVRQVYELLTPSCHLEPACRVRAEDDRPRVCWACSLFGAPSLGGRLRFGEASPVESARVDAIRVPRAWGNQKGKPGTTRVYDLSPGQSEGAPSNLTEWTFAVSGRFASKLLVTNATDEELGLLFAALGLGAKRPALRLGGKKFHGLGLAEPVLTSVVWQKAPAKHETATEDLQAWVKSLVSKAVLAHSNRKEKWEHLQGVINLFR